MAGCHGSRRVRLHDGSPPRRILAPDEWCARGRARRERLPLADHAHWDPSSDRPDPVAVLEEQAKARVPDLVPIRDGRMLSSAFAYYRTAATPMAWSNPRPPLTGPLLPRIPGPGPGPPEPS